MIDLSGLNSIRNFTIQSCEYTSQGILIFELRNLIGSLSNETSSVYGCCVTERSDSIPSQIRETYILHAKLDFLKLQYFSVFTLEQ